MDRKIEDIKRQKFKEILYELAISQDVLKRNRDKSEYIKRLEELYYIDKDTRFNHFYSDIFVVMSDINAGDVLGDINVLSQNVKLLRSGYQARNKDDIGNIKDISGSLKKLLDHVSLEQARFSHTVSTIHKETQKLPLDDLTSKTATLQSTVEEFSEKIETLRIRSDDVMHEYELIKEDFDIIDTDFEGIKKELEDSKAQYISILGIFSSVVLSFTAGIAFSTSVLENIDKVSTYRLIFVSCILGLVLLNIIFALFYYIGTLTGKEGKVEPIFIANFVFVIIMLLTLLAWDSGAIERRDKKFEDAAEDAKTVVITQVYSESSDK